MFILDEKRTAFYPTMDKNSINFLGTLTPFGRVIYRSIGVRKYTSDRVQIQLEIFFLSLLYSYYYHVSLW